MNGLHLTADLHQRYVCNYGANHSAKAPALMDALIALFQPGRSGHHARQRGAAAP